jgi:putative ABC transport system ATP-binding protein
MTASDKIQPLLVADHVSRTFHLEGEEVHAVRDISLTINRGRFVAIVGRSGSGKTTLLNLLAGLDTPSTGQVLFDGRNVADMGEKEMTELRRHSIGIVFQSFGLLPLLSAFENVELPLRIAGVGARERNERAEEVLDLVGLLPRARHRPFELSGGEQQRVAIARAVAMRPSVILADEPTGELDSANAESIFGLFSQMAGAEEMAIVTTTHDQTLLDMAQEVHVIGDGLIVESGNVEFDRATGSPIVILGESTPATRAAASPASEVSQPVADDNIFRRPD